MLRLHRLILLAVLLVPATVYAQDEDIPPLTETYTVTDYDLDFQYPVDWEVSGAGASAIMFSAPIGGTGQPTESGVAVEGGATVIFWTFEGADTTAEAAAQAAAEDFVGGESTIFEISEPQRFSINGRTAAQVDVTSMVFLQRFIGMELDARVIVTVEMLGFEEGVVRATPITLEMLGTVRPSGTPLPGLPPVVRPELTQSHTRQADQTSFSAPADWLIEETDNFTLLTAPNGVTVGISSEPIPSEGDIVMDTIAIITDNLMRQLPGIEVNEVEEFEVNSRRAARVVGLESDAAFAFWALDLGGEVVGHISVIGPPDDVRELEATIFAIAETITTGQVSEHYVEEGALTFSETITSEDGSFTINYAAGWTALPIEDFIVLTSPNVDPTGDFLSLAKGEFVIIVQNSLGFLAEQTGLTLPQVSDPATIARLVAQNAEANDNPQTIEKLSINGRSASLIYGPDGDLDSAVLIFEMDDGRLGSLNARIAPGELDNMFSVFLAIASSLSPR